jgi:hypothetical protein
MKIKRVSEGKAKNSYDVGDVIKIGELRYQFSALLRFEIMGKKESVVRNWAPFNVQKTQGENWDAGGCLASTPRAAVILAMKQAQKAALIHYNGYALAAKNAKKDLIGIREFLSSVKSKSKQVSK